MYNSHCAAALGQSHHSKGDKDGHGYRQFDSRTEDLSHQPPGKSSDRVYRVSIGQESLVAGSEVPCGLEPDLLIMHLSNFEQFLCIYAHTIWPCRDRNAVCYNLASHNSLYLVFSISFQLVNDKIW